MNDVIRSAAAGGLGLGEALGAAVRDGDFPHKDASVLAAALCLGVPVTVHVGVGYDILHEHPNCDGAALGQTSYHDFLTFAATVERLEGGVLLNFGTAVMGPEVYLKALAMARNVAHQEGRSIRHFSTGVFEIVSLDVEKKRIGVAPVPEGSSRAAAFEQGTDAAAPQTEAAPEKLGSLADKLRAALEPRDP